MVFDLKVLEFDVTVASKSRVEFGIIDNDLKGLDGGLSNHIPRHTRPLNDKSVAICIKIRIDPASIDKLQIIPEWAEHRRCHQSAGNKSVTCSVNVTMVSKCSPTISTDRYVVEYLSVILNFKW